MTRIFTLLLLLLGVQTLHATTKVLSQDYGYDPADATFFLQQALNDATADTLVVDAAPGPWTSGPLFLRRDNVTLIFEPGVLLRGLSTADVPDAFGTFESLLRIDRADNVTILGGGATFQMFKREYEIFSEFRHCLDIFGATNVTVRDLNLIGAPGDGILIGPAFTVTNGVGLGDVPCRNITVINCTMDDNNRQGMSVTDVIGLRIDSCRFINTSGTLPQAGLDFEPFETFQRMQDILVTNSLFEGNNAPGVLVACVDLDNTSPPMDIIMDNCTFRNNGLDLDQPLGGIVVSNKFRAPGSFIVRNSLVEDEVRSGLNVRQFAEGIDVRMENVIFRNTSRTPLNVNTGPILIQPVEYNQPQDDPFGNVAFDNVTVFDDRDRLHFTALQFGSADGPREPPVRDLTGEVTICTPDGIEPQTRVGPLLGPNVTISFPDCDDEGPDAITAIRAPEAVVAGRTYTIEVGYQANQDRDVITTFQFNSGSYQSFAYVITPVPAGERIVRIDVPIRADAPLGDDAYQWSTYIVPSGGRYSDRFDGAVQRPADVIPASAATDNSIAIVDAPDAVVAGRTYPFEVEYVASEPRDIITTFQYDFGTYESFAYVITPVPAGERRITIDVPIWATAPVGEADFQWSTYIVPAGTRYSDRLGLAVKRNVDVVPGATERRSSGRAGLDFVSRPVPSTIAYPNPTSGDVTLRFGEDAMPADRITVTDLAGRAVRVIDIPTASAGHELPLDLSMLPDGVYVLSFGEGAARLKIVLAR